MLNTIEQLTSINPTDTSTNPVTIAKVLEQTVFAGLDWNDPRNDALGSLLSFTDDLRELAEHVEAVQREFANILALCVQERVNNGMTKGANV